MKNKTKKRVGIVAMMLMLVVAIGATAGTTLAKYISSATITSETATVAQWGYTLTADVSKMFGENYGNVNAEKHLAKVVDAENNTAVVVSGDSGKKVVAPGTTGNLAFTVNGTAEVNAILKITLDTDAFKTVVLYDGENGKVEYYPIKWSVGGIEVEPAEGSKTVGTTDFAEVIGKVFLNKRLDVEVAVDGDDVLVFIPANTPVNSVDLSISWEWALGDEGFEMTEKDAEDTLLGLISYSRQTEELDYDNLPQNIQTWLKTTYASEDERAAITTKQGEVTSKQEAVAVAQAAVKAAQATVDADQKAVDEQEFVVADAQAAFDAVAILGEGNDYYEAAKGVLEAATTELGRRQDALAQAKEALGAPSDDNGTVASGKYADLESAQRDLVEAEEALADAEEVVTEAAKTGYANLVTEENTKIEVAYGLTAVIAQTQMTAGEFAAEYSDKLVTAD